MDDMRPNQKKLVEMGYEDSIIFEMPDYDSAIIGITCDERVVYDYNKMLEHLYNTGDYGDWSECADFISYNSSFYIDPKQPLIMYPLEE